MSDPDPDKAQALLMFPCKPNVRPDLSYLHSSYLLNTKSICCDDANFRIEIKPFCF